MKAIVFYELALHFNPRCAEACNNLGVIYKDRDNLDKAVECYQVSKTNNVFLFKYFRLVFTYFLFAHVL
jgi:tetratricopeptide (TPR) repeat protein